MRPVVCPAFERPFGIEFLAYEKFYNFDVLTVYQVPGQKGKWFMSFIGFNGQGYNSFVAESSDLLKWTNPQLAMGFGKEGQFEFGGCVVGACLVNTRRQLTSLVPRHTFRQVF